MALKTGFEVNMLVKISGLEIGSIFIQKPVLRTLKSFFLWLYFSGLSKRTKNCKKIVKSQSAGIEPIPPLYV